MGATSYYGLPYPDPTSSVDVPRDIKALADKLELWKNGFIVPTGDIALGLTSDATARALVFRKLDPPDIYEGKIYIQAGSDWAFVYFKNGVEITRFRLAQDGSLGTGTGATYRPLPFATANVTCSVTASSSATGSGSFTLPANRFTQTPLVQVTGSGGGSSFNFLATNGLSTSGGNVSLRHLDNTAQTVTVTAHVFACQMFPASAPGRAAPTTVEEDGLISVTVTCHIEGCENQNVPLNLTPMSLEAPITCGVCGNLIEDVSTKARKRR